jgi:hypothetical protein
MKKSLLLSVIFLCTVWMSHGQWTYTNLSTPKKFMGIASSGTKAYFAGGYNGFNTTSLVEVYDVATGVWSNTENLSLGRQVATGVACGSKLFFAGGANSSMSEVYSTVDIYDIASDQWSVNNLSVARFDISAVSKGNKVLFAGGCNYDILCTDMVDIYDIPSGFWSTENLSSARAGMASAVVGDLALFAGGFITGGGVSSRVDIYNFATDTWSIAYLSEARVWATAVTVNDKVIIAGGIKAFPGHPSDRVDIFNSSNNTWSTATLTEARAWIAAGAVNGRAYFAGGSNVANGGIPYNYTDIIDIYNDADSTWDTDLLSQPRASHGLAVGSHFLVAGGSSETGLLSSVEIFTDAIVIHVPADYPTIQQAIDAAEAGDTVLVAEGTYYENINFNGKAIIVASEFLMDSDVNHISSTVINGRQPVDPDYGSVVTFRSGEDTTSVLCGFTITGGSGTIEPSVHYKMGGGVQISFSGAKLLNNIIEDNTVSSNSVAYGGGIQAGGPIGTLPWVVMRNNTIRNNKAISSGEYGMGGGITVFYNLILADNNISYNEVNCPAGCDGGGASINASFSPTRLDVKNNIIRYNKAVSLGANSQYTIGGGLVIAFPSSGIVSDNDISFNQIESADNTWGQATGVLVQEVIADDFVFENNFITNNTHVGQYCMGGGMLLYECGGIFQNNVIQDNTGTHGAGIAIQDSPDNQPAFINNTVSGNLASVQGGGIYLESSSANVINTIIWGNTAPSGSSIYKLGSTLEVRYSDVEGDELWPGEGNMMDEPQFLIDGYHLDDSCMMVNAGISSIMINNVMYECPPYDIDGDPRPYQPGTRPEIGVDEVLEVSVDEPIITDNSSINVFPNPASDKITIKVPESGQNVNMIISIFGITGQEQIIRPINNPVCEINISSLYPGVYFYRISTVDNRQLAIGKLIKY